MKKFLKAIINIIGGLAVGFINGFFGGGGGMLCVPLLEKVAGESTRVAHATAILIILPISIVSSIIYIVGGSLEVMTAVWTGAGVLAGGIGGALLLKVLPPKITGAIFAIMMIAAGVMVIFR